MTQDAFFFGTEIFDIVSIRKVNLSVQLICTLQEQVTNGIYRYDPTGKTVSSFSDVCLCLMHSELYWLIAVLWEYICASV